MIGNDIIDLSLAKTQSNWQRRGFLEKQFTHKEQVAIHASEKPFLMVWRMWSMKESAYKIIAQQEQRRFYAPKKFKCELTSSDKGFVCFQDEKFYTSTELNTFFIHTVASLEKETKAYSEIGSSYKVNKDIKKKLQEKIGVLASEIEQIKSDVGAPNYYHNDKLLLQSCSISHHGNYGAFSLLF